ncbi:MAG: hypothetical protein OXP66_04140 [Candidatus Tectomicrobia bacterium]|nr:hypothetical protein [Candidatus Tectomicrobia bacterium]
MMEEGMCVGCGGDCLGILECSCGCQEVNACQDCVDSGTNLVCGDCRDRAVGADTLIPYPCGGFDEAAPVRGTVARLPVAAAVGA